MWTRNPGFNGTGRSLGEGTHMVMVEKNRMQFIHEIELFLEEAQPQALN